MGKVDINSLKNNQKVIITSKIEKITELNKDRYKIIVKNRVFYYEGRDPQKFSGSNVSIIAKISKYENNTQFQVLKISKN